MILEVGFKLEKKLSYYDRLLKSNGLINCFNCVTHDIYYTNKNLDNLSENEMKRNCVRIRIGKDKKCKVENQETFPVLEKIKFSNKLKEVEAKLIEYGFVKIFDTKKKDHHYTTDKMNSRIQLQEIKKIGLIVYYDNSLYYDLGEEEQRNKLIDELNRYGFSFKYSDLGIDKLRTLYYKKEMFSKNQNG